jgi:hypothetical protein
MRKLVYYSIPIIVLIVFVLIMNSGGYLKRPRGEEEDLPGLIKIVEEDLLNERWDSVSLNVDRLKNTWQKVIPRVQFSVERDEILAINRGLARIQGFIKARDKAGALAEISEINEHWNDLEK